MGRSSFLLFFFIVFGSNLATAVEIVDIPAQPWESSAAHGFAQRVCDGDRSKIETYLQTTHRPYRPALMRQSGKNYCHIVYEPSVRGFKAKVDYGAAHSLVFSVSEFPLALGRNRTWGDTFDIFHVFQQHFPNLPKIVLSRLPQGPWTTFPTIELEATPMDWTQDFIVSGSTPSQSQSILIPHRIFQGDLSKGDRFEPFLREWSTKAPLANGRSKLSWEGGDLVILKAPAGDQTLLIYGDSVFKYWAKGMTSDEVEFVLREEFGVDHVLNGRGLSSHVDYTLLPLDEKRLLFRSPFNQNTEFICDVVDLMLEDFKQNLRIVPDRLGKLKKYACGIQPQVDVLRAMIGEAELEYIQNEGNWVINRNFEGMDGEFQGVGAKYCASQEANELSTCFQKIFTSVGALSEVKKTHPKLVRAHLDSLVDGVSNRHRYPAYFALLNGQVDPITPSRLLRLAEMKQKLARLGYELIEVPSPAHESIWAGLSYVNSLVVDKKLFLPSIGLRSFEPILKNDLKKKIPDFDVHFVRASAQIFNNGGIHCSVKAIR